MKNNDFDFIKNRFDSVEPSMPDSLNKEILRQKISSNEEHKTIKFEQKKNYFKPIISAAACFILITGIAFAANSDVFNTEKISGFGNYDEINSKITELEKESSVSEGGCGIFNTTLVKDEENVEKPDVVKTDGEYIYCAYFDVEGYTNRNKVYIYKIQDNESEFVSVIDKLASDTDGEYSDFYKINTLFVYNNRLVIILDKSNPMSADKYKRDFNTTIIKIYDISDKSNPSLITEIEQSGEYNQARMISGILYLTSDYNVETNDKNYTIPWIKQNEETTYASSKNIVCFENAKTAQYAVISTIDVETGELSKGLKAVLGGSAKIYCTKDYMYINEYIEGERYGEPERDVTSAMKLNFKNGKFTYASETEVKQYSNNTIDIGRGDMYDSFLYPFGEYYISLGHDANDFKDEIILFDKNMKELDSIIFENECISVNTNLPRFDKNTNTITLPANYYDEGIEDYHYQGAVVLEITNNKIEINDRIKDSTHIINIDYENYYYCPQIVYDNCIYSIYINNNAPDNKKLKVFSYKF